MTNAAPESHELFVVLFLGLFAALDVPAATHIILLGNVVKRNILTPALVQLAVGSSHRVLPHAKYGSCNLNQMYKLTQVHLSFVPFVEIIEEHFVFTLLHWGKLHVIKCPNHLINANFALASVVNHSQTVCHAC